MTLPPARWRARRDRWRRQLRRVAPSLRCRPRGPVIAPAIGPDQAGFDCSNWVGRRESWIFSLLPHTCR